MKTLSADLEMLSPIGEILSLIWKILSLIWTILSPNFGETLSPERGEFQLLPPPPKEDPGAQFFQPFKAAPPSPKSDWRNKKVSYSRGQEEEDFFASQGPESSSHAHVSSLGIFCAPTRRTTDERPKRGMNFDEI